MPASIRRLLPDLAGWDGQPPKQTRELIGGHIERYERYADNISGACCA